MPLIFYTPTGAYLGSVQKYRKIILIIVVLVAGRLSGSLSKIAAKSPATVNPEAELHLSNAEADVGIPAPGETNIYNVTSRQNEISQIRNFIRGELNKKGS
jgi:hypothetical protein